ncbi:hypothetical protein BCR37DRAFT_382355 [Protomyces lactucae-debilis]|uniref:F-box domain-containing protein n=1 Tax=Protomyces lactucae-debilis TaxID=2754530 RepID=A0A1Y2F2J7_PROLT|nr:uncharacterized protein BCR37DRAFT_382355 [Protomyces lactucae-debilis]ORY78110.1 hypothetical protein BCR37DRAFT_382355 [Protomyces lactucae-debilis]
MDQLPHEVLLKILRHLDPYALDSTRSTCRFLNELIDESVWRDALVCRSAISHGIIPRIHPSWRIESLRRTQAIRDFHRGQGNVFVINPRIGEINSDTIRYDFERERAIFASIDSSHGVIANTATGKIAARDKLLPEWESHYLCLISTLETSQGSFLYCFTDGRVAMMILNASRHWQLQVCQDRHNARIVRCASSGSRAVTLDEDRYLKVWDVPSGHCNGTLRLPRSNVLSFELDGDSVITCALLFRPNTHAMCAFTHFNVASRQLIDDWAWPAPYSLTEPFVVSFDPPCVLLPGTVEVCIVEFWGQPIQCTRTTRQDIAARALGPPGPNRWMAIAAFGGVIDVYNLADPSTPCLSRKVEVRDGADITSLAISKTVIAVGHKDGSASLIDIVSGRALRPLNKRMTRRFDRDDRWDGAPVVRSIHLHPHEPRGLLDLRYEIIAFNFAPSQPVKGHGKRKPLRQKLSQDRASVSTAIQQELQHLGETQEEANREHRRLLRLAGDLSTELTEEELLAYTRMLSEQDGELDEAMRRSLALEERTAAEDELEAAEDADISGMSYQDQLDLAIALSLP